MSGLWAIPALAFGFVAGAVFEHVRRGGTWDWRRAYGQLERQAGMDAMRRARHLIERGLVR